MESELKLTVSEQFAEISKVLEAMSSSLELRDEIHRAAMICHESLSNGGKILLAGNGGSAADSQHIAAEFVNYFNFSRPGLAAIALTTDTSVLTSISNDSHFELVFSRQIEALGQPGDVFFAYSTSGNSKNVVKAAEVAKAFGLSVIGLTGQSAGALDAHCDVNLKTPSTATPHIQEGHLVMGHIISGLVEQMFFTLGTDE